MNLDIYNKCHFEIMFTFIKFMGDEMTQMTNQTEAVVFSDEEHVLDNSFIFTMLSATSSLGSLSFKYAIQNLSLKKR